MPKVKGRRLVPCPEPGCKREFVTNWNGEMTPSYLKHVAKIHTACDQCGYVGVKVARHKAAVHG